MKKPNKILPLVVLSMLIALGVVISPILRFEGMCPMAHFINIVCSVLLGPWYSLACALLIGILRMSVMAIPPIALTGAVFGAVLSGVLYRLSKGKLLAAVIGEVIGTGIIGAVASYPVMTLFWGKQGLSLLFYVPSFVCGTLIGGSIAYIFLKKLSSSGLLAAMQTKLMGYAYADKSTVLSTSASIAAGGIVCYMVINIFAGVFKISSPVLKYISYFAVAVFLVIAIIYYITEKRKSK